MTIRLIGLVAFALIGSWIVGSLYYTTKRLYQTEPGEEQTLGEKLNDQFRKS